MLEGGDLGQNDLRVFDKEKRTARLSTDGVDGSRRHPPHASTHTHTRAAARHVTHPIDRQVLEYCQKGINSVVFVALYLWPFSYNSYRTSSFLQSVCRACFSQCVSALPAVVKL